MYVLKITSHLCSEYPTPAAPVLLWLPSRQPSAQRTPEGAPATEGSWSPASQPCPAGAFEVGSGAGDLPQDTMGCHRSSVLQQQMKIPRFFWWIATLQAWDILSGLRLRATSFQHLAESARPAALRPIWRAWTVALGVLRGLNPARVESCSIVDSVNHPVLR